MKLVFAVLALLTVSIVSMAENQYPAPQFGGYYGPGAGGFNQPGFNQGGFNQPGFNQGGMQFGNPYMAPGVYHNGYNQGGGTYGPWGSNQWNSHGSATVIVQPPVYYPQPYPYPVMVPCPIRPPVYCHPLPSWNCNPCGPSYFNFGVQFGF